MENALLDALARGFQPRPARAKGFAVVERGYSGERIVFQTSSRAEAERIAMQHGARRVVEV